MSDGYIKFNDVLTAIGNMLKEMGSKEVTVKAEDYDLSGFCDKLYKAGYDKGLSDAERKVGKWVKTGQSFIHPDTFKGYSCSCCGYFISKEDVLFLYCPSCGAVMKKGDSE